MNFKQIISQFTLGHLALMAAVGFALGGLTVAQNWSAAGNAIETINANGYEAPSETVVAYHQPVNDGSAASVALDESANAVVAVLGTISNDRSSEVRGVVTTTTPFLPRGPAASLR
jgi:hypothetical protein